MWKYIKQKKWLVIVSVLVSFLQVGITLWQPDLTANIIKNLNVVDAAGNASIDKSAVFNACSLVIIVGFIGLILGIINTFIAAKVSMFVGTELRSELFTKIQNFTLHQIQKFSESKLIVRLTNDVMQIQQLVMITLQMLIRIPLMFIGCIYFTTISIPQYWWSTFLYLIIVVLLMFTTIKRLIPRFSKTQVINENLNTIVKENVDGARVVKSFVQEDSEKNKYSKVVDQFCDNFKKIGYNFGILISSTTLVANLIILLVLYLLSKTGINYPESIANIVSFSQYIMILMSTVVNGGFLMNQFGRAMVSVKRINELLNVKDENKFLSKPIEEIKSIEFKNVSFCYENSDEAFLKDINFSLKKGEKIGIIGLTGSGKTTLAQLISQLYIPTEGEILINGESQFDFDYNQLLDHIAIVLQKANLFSGTIESNIQQGKKDANIDELTWASELAQAKEFIDKKENKFNTEVYQKGANFSGGQKQRISIARALVKKPDILILDDSTSALDAKSEQLVKDAIYNKLEDMGVIIIAQKISSIIETDKIIVMNNGSIEMIGTHEDLLKTSQLYNEIYSTQKDNDEK